MPSLSPHIRSVPPSGIRRIFELAQHVDDVVFLAVGEPDVAVAPHIIAAAQQAWARDDTDYSPNGGIAPLRRAIQAKLARENGIEVDLEQIWATAGATQALHQAMGLLLDPGDEVLVPDPGYTTFTMNARMLGAEPVPYALRPELGFLPDLDELERLVTARTRVLIVNSPSNPLGRVFPEATLRALLDFASAHDLWILSDEVYEAFTGAERHTSIAALDTEDRVFTVFSLSKTYAMTGIRVGYLVTPPGLTQVMSTVQEAAISCVSMPGQYAALAAIEGVQSHVAAAAEHYRGNRALAEALLDERGIGYLRAEGAFYLWLDASPFSDGDVSGWAERLLLQQRVALAPGRAFGVQGEGWARVCLAADPATLREGLTRLPSLR